MAETGGGQQEARGAPVFAQLAELLTRASWRLRRSEVKELSSFGLTFAQARALRILARRGEPMRISDVAVSLEIVPRSATAVVDALERAGLVHRQMDALDRRSVLAALTDEARGLLERMAEERSAGAEALFGRLSAEQQEKLLELLETLERGAGGLKKGAEVVA